METEDVKKYIGKRVLIILKNGLKITTTIPEFDADSFSTKDKFEDNCTITCSSIDFIKEERS